MEWQTDFLKKGLRSFCLFTAGILMPIALLFLFPHAPLGESIELAWLDMLFTLRGHHRAPENVVIVAIDEASFREIGLQWPWPRALHAQLIRKLRSAGANVVAFDVMFVEPSSVPSDDEIFALSISEAGNVVLGEGVSAIHRKNYDELILSSPLTLLTDAGAVTGLVNFFPDIDGIIRHGRFRMNGMYTLSFRAVSIYDPALLKDMDPDAPPFLIDFAGPSGSFHTVSYYQALEPSKYLPDNFFVNSIVVVGLSSDAAVEVSRGAVDAFPTPFFRFSRKAMFGVEIHANTIATILDGLPLREWRHPVIFCCYILLVLIPFLLRRHPLGLTGFVFLSVASLVCVSLFAFLHLERVLFVGTPVIGILLSSLFWGVSGYSSTFMERRRIRGAFDRYVPPAVVDEVLKNPEQLNLGGQKRELSVLFSDIRGFTSLSEQFSPEVLVDVLNEYLDRMTDQVFAFEGLLDKFIGDAIMAVYGAPVFRDDHAICACRTALAMIRALADVKRVWKSHGVPGPEIGIGINTGQMIVGNMGSSARFDYTVIGDEVNLASRFEGLNKQYGTSIIIGENTLYAIGGAFLCRELDMVRVKGKKRPVKIYELVEECDGACSVPAYIEMFHVGLEWYRDGNWREAMIFFKKALELRKEDRPSIMFMERCSMLLENQPEEWDGVWTMMSK